MKDVEKSLKEQQSLKKRKQALIAELLSDSFRVE